jgi:hypothetical protein
MAKRGKKGGVQKGSKRVKKGKKGQKPGLGGAGQKGVKKGVPRICGDAKSLSQISGILPDFCPPQKKKISRFSEISDFSGFSILKMGGSKKGVQKRRLGVDLSPRIY